ncbi:MAG TPA: ATP-dependent DNA helicase RecG [Candidatus Krumholzibacteria bacterium]|nr:ATP-dependent DNA helicase RecG [Candidatus Krumholzibacteria bacterium]
MAARLDDPCRYLKGVGPRRADALEKLGVRTAEELLLHAPRQYFDRTHVQPIATLQADTDACVRVQVESLHARPSWGGRGRVVATVCDDSGRLRVTWYTPWVREVLQPGHRLVLAGHVVRSRSRLEMRQPEFERADDEAQELVHAARIVPFYPLVRGVSQKWLRTLMRRTLDTHLEHVQEILPDTVRGDLPTRGAALAALHFPEDAEAAGRALRRFKFEELFLLEVVLARRRRRARESSPGPAMQRERSRHERYLEQLPFTLTGAQARVLDEILQDMTSGRCMQRLVQGDVGSGKTVLAAAALLCAAGNGTQAALMAPTEVLALQHAERLLPAFTALEVRMDVLVGSRSDADKQRVRGRVASGDLDVVVGTHALIQEDVRWQRLGLAVVDEQHRFGVLQRMRLQQDGGGRPHVLVLSATPIPRSLALTLFGDLDVSSLDEKPPGRQTVQTRLVPPHRRADMLRFVRTELQAGRQGFMVYPLVEESDKIALRAASEEFERLRAGALAGLRIGLLHGRLRAAEKETLLHAFRRGEVSLLVSTTVVEVGIDVATADLMIIHHPDRFGLSQLHQLRGRVGRGGNPAWCFLLQERNSSEESLERLRAFARTEDGFAIAALDLALRGPGDFVGTRQHGLPTLRFADLAQDLEVLDRARHAAFALIDLDPELALEEHRAMREHLDTHYRMQEALAAVG